MNTLAVVSIIFFLISTAFAQKFGAKGSPEVVPQMAALYDGEARNSGLNKVTEQLLNALTELENLQEGGHPLKMAAEKRRNKFEFIRFGRK
ncbi:unnamed protein product [Caenorhabditis bovis]|uniref:Uncharacterized protein n=1 Tax=Caenorhabditis bovis TaxID=2654633 RepID=A0A8S1EGI4_9PELO|nr:unnamed protein product [Caenorhabditis bovis]